MKLLEHFKRMQTMAAQYLTPEPYQGFTTGNVRTLVGTADEDKETFVRDMIYMLDSPEQREAQAEAQAEVAGTVDDLRLVVRTMLRDHQLTDHIAQRPDGTWVRASDLMA